MAESKVAPMTPKEMLPGYFRKVREFPMLSREEEYSLVARWREHRDPAAAHRLVTSHLRLVAKIAIGYRRYGLPVSELISEGSVGTMRQAMTQFKGRERNILMERRLREHPPTLLELSRKHGITSERVRQIEARAFEKLQNAILSAAVERRLVTP